MMPSGVIGAAHGIECADIQARLFAPFPAKSASGAMQTCAIRRRVVPQAVLLLADGGDVHRFAGMKDRREDESLTERGLEITGYERMQMRRDVA